MAQVEEGRRVHVHVSAWINEAEVIEENSEAAIPPDYDAADVKALFVRKIEDTAFALVRREFGREPTKAALIAYVARQRGIERVLDETIGDVTELRIRIREILEVSNNDATTRWGEEPEGH